MSLKVTEARQGIRNKVEKCFGVLFVEFVEELPHQVSNLKVWVSEYDCKVAKVRLNLDHIIQRQMSDDGQGIFPDIRVPIMEVLVEATNVGLNYIWKSVKQVAHRNNQVVFDYCTNIGALEQPYQVRELFLTVAATQAHHLAVCKHTDYLQL